MGRGSSRRDSTHCRSTGNTHTKKTHAQDAIKSLTYTRVSRQCSENSRPPVCSRHLLETTMPLASAQDTPRQLAPLSARFAVFRSNAHPSLCALSHPMCRRGRGWGKDGSCLCLHAHAGATSVAAARGPSSSFSSLCRVMMSCICPTSTARSPKQGATSTPSTRRCCSNPDTRCARPIYAPGTSQSVNVHVFP